MFLRRAVLAVIALSLWAAEKPNFTGAWQLDLKRSEFGENYPIPQSRTDTIRHDEPNLSVTQHEVLSGGREVEGTVRYTTDGKECTNVVMGNPLKATAGWDGTTLVIETWGNFGGADIRLKDRWSLSGGKTLTILRHFESQDRTADQKIVFMKK